MASKIVLQILQGGFQKCFKQPGLAADKYSHFVITVSKDLLLLPDLRRSSWPGNGLSCHCIYSHLIQMSCDANPVSCPLDSRSKVARMWR
jgi:hypothetical protein